MGIIIGICTIVLGISIVVISADFPTLASGYPGPGLFPQILGILFFLSGLTISIERIAARDWPRFNPFQPGTLKVFLVISAVLFYVVCSNILGFFLTVFIILTGLMFILKVPLYVSLGLGAGVTLTIHLIFYKLLGVPLPVGLLIEGFNLWKF